MLSSEGGSLLHYSGLLQRRVLIRIQGKAAKVSDAFGKWAMAARQHTLSLTRISRRGGRQRMR